MRKASIQPTIVFIWFSLFLCSLALVVITSLLMGGVEGERAATREEAKFVRIGNQLSAASDYLTSSVRGFVVDNDPRHLQRYWEEIDFTQGRENALRKLRQLDSSPEERRLLKEAKVQSDALVDTEVQGMKLVLHAYGVPEEAMHPAIANYQLAPDQLALSPTEKIRVAQKIMFDREYGGRKDRIRSSIGDYQSAMAERFRQQTREAKSYTDTLLLLAIIFSALNLLLIIFLVWMRLLAVRREDKTS